jgi:hypothetical protein
MDTVTWFSRLGVGRKADGFVLQKEKKNISAKSKKQKPDGIWQNLLRKAVAQEGLFCRCSL